MKLSSLFMMVSFVTSGFALPATAQVPPLKVPEASPRASVSQTVGLTDIAVHYHRPAVNRRTIWGALVPYGEVWRAGANENTTISFSTPVRVEGKPLAAGTYGLHMIPTAKQWTVIFSTVANAWGSYSYEPKEDALRVEVTPSSMGDNEERLSYRFDDPTETSVWVVLRWEKLRVPIRIEVDTPQIVIASMRNELRGVAQFSWHGWDQAARYLLNHGGNLDEAAALVERSLSIGVAFANLNTKAAIQEKKGNLREAQELRGRAMTLATESDLNAYGYSLLEQKKLDEAVAIFKRNAKEHPGSWNAFDSLGEAQEAAGDKRGASESYQKALDLVPDPANKKRIGEIIARLRGK